ncbi:hypothetical protein ACFS07_16630 [Undibacterium arcticum]
MSIQAQPGSLTCALSNTSGTASGQPISNVNVACTTNTHTLGGTVSGLTTTGLALTNGSDTVTIAAGQTSFVFFRQGRGRHRVWGRDSDATCGADLQRAKWHSRNGVCRCH